MSTVKKILITGASGFLGSNLLKCLKDNEEYKIYALSSRPLELKERIGDSKILFLDKNAFAENNSGELLSDAIVVNCAYPRNVLSTAIASGLRYIQQLFSFSAENGARAIINISSQSVYSSHRAEAASEETNVCLDSIYAVGKYATELMLEAACRKSETNYVNIRMASLIGPNFDQRIVNRFVKSALETRKIKVVDSPQKFGFFDIEDAVNGLCTLIASNSENWNAVYNLGRCECYTLRDIAEKVAAVIKNKCGKDTLIFYEMGSDNSSSELNAALFMKSFDYCPRISMQESIERITDSYLKNSIS